jgi:hypothetical protein
MTTHRTFQSALRRRAAQCLLLSFVGAGTGCAPAKHYLTYSAAANKWKSSVPSYVGVGDSVILVVENVLRADRYTGTVAAEALTEAIQSPLAGAVEIKKMAEVFLPSDLLRPALSGTSDESESFIPKSANLTFGLGSSTWKAGSDAEAALAELRALVAVPPGETPTALRTRRAKATTARTTLLAGLQAARAQAAEERDLAVQACSIAVATLAAEITATPAHGAWLAFVLDEDARRLATELTTFPLIKQLDGAIATVERDSAARLDTTRLHALRSAFPAYARLLELLTLRYHADPAAPPPTAAFGAALRSAATCDLAARTTRTALASLERDITGIEELVKGSGLALEPLPRVPGPEPVPVPKRVVAGIELARFTAKSDAELQPMHDFLGTVSQVARQAGYVANTLNALPRFTADTSVDSTGLGAYYAPTRLNITLTRAARYGRVTVVPTVTAVAPATTPSAATLAGGAGGTAEEGKQGAHKPTEPKLPAVPAALQLTPNGEPLPTASIQVLQRYRYRVSVGMTRSTLNARTYEVSADTLRVAGLAPTRLFPTAALSVAVLPLRGQYIAAQASAWDTGPGWTWETARNLIRRMGLWGQLGLSISDPTRQVFVGLATDPFPGVTLSFGQHLGYVESLNPGAAVDQRVAAGTVPTRKSWERARAVALTLDASVVLGSFGTLLGLK